MVRWTLILPSTEELDGDAHEITHSQARRALRKPCGVEERRPGFRAWCFPNGAQIVGEYLVTLTRGSDGLTR